MAKTNSLHAAFDTWASSLFEGTFTHVKQAFPNVKDWNMEDVGDDRLEAQMNLSFKDVPSSDYCMCTVSVGGDGTISLGAIAIHREKDEYEDKVVPVHTADSQIAKTLCDLLIAANKKAGTNRHLF